MGVLDLFSKRQKRLNGSVLDVFAYDQIPPPLRVQLTQIIRDAIGETSEQGPAIAYAQINKALCREYGVFALSAIPGLNDMGQILDHLLSTVDVDHVLDIVELSLRIVNGSVRDQPFRYKTRKASPDDSISEVNTRFREHGIGYEFIAGEIIRIDSQIIHAEVVKPAISILQGKQFAGANEEFMKAHEHYRQGKNKECLVECLKAFESTMKAVCDAKGWSYSSGDTASRLVDVCIHNGLFPTFMQSHLGSLKSILESGVPTVRNKLAGHGQGGAVVSVTEEMARFALHCTATNIVYIAESADLP